MMHMKKIKVHIDPRGYNEKPSNKEIGGIKARLQKNTRPSLVTLEELVQKIETGHSISPGIMDGMSAKDWQEQQLFLVDIDNEEDGPILRVKDARAICRDNGLPLAFYPDVECEDAGEMRRMEKGPRHPIWMAGAFSFLT